ncbi:beta-ketoacyl synthase N-terminal-like domain-containing protein [Flavobacterium hercynium]|uniref:Beta-ketoacyl synthase-like N-terminal domain-containing protein n=1 Tax=Flavobacterium hercynium TaxID=387094 RepID=A0A226HMG9_9FLAO|nr:beta-ketoacyl synthase N-terminal-like domain-containing protein [Flavobacterium hercynium]OXA94826.1 hypothetical protein B0A66_03605 [Flavobacterium hercynium]SMP08186.1 3-oxoacyl-[acyl-carrier-protein] synthase II [Flavobacterium hercynium]
MKKNNSWDIDIAISEIGFNSPYGTEINTFFSEAEANPVRSLILDDHDPQEYLKAKGQRFLNKATLIYCNTAFDAIHGRNLTKKIKKAPHRVGLYDGTELSNLDDCFVFDLTAKNQGPDRVSPMKSPSTIANAAASQMAIQAGIKGPNFSVCAGMAGSLQALDIASMHLRQDMIDYGVVASTEIRNDYQKAIRTGHQNKLNPSAELGISMILEHLESVEEDGRMPLAILKKMYSETHTDETTSLETHLYEMLSEIADSFYFDTVIISGGLSVIDTSSFENILGENNLDITVLYPESTFGDFDNVGGMLGIAYGISIFNDKNDYKTDHDNIVVLSVDKTGTIIYALIERGN